MISPTISTSHGIHVEQVAGCPGRYAVAAELMINFRPETHRIERNNVAYGWVRLEEAIHAALTEEFPSQTRAKHQ
jgi:hypothetical protein